jgi:hypothetical protein
MIATPQANIPKRMAKQKAIIAPKITTYAVIHFLVAGLIWPFAMLLPLIFCFGFLNRLPLHV